MLYDNPVCAILFTSAGLLVDKKVPNYFLCSIFILDEKPHTHVYALFSYLVDIYEKNIEELSLCLLRRSYSRAYLYFATFWYSIFF